MQIQRQEHACDVAVGGTWSTWMIPWAKYGARVTSFLASCPPGTLSTCVTWWPRSLSRPQQAPPGEGQAASAALQQAEERLQALLRGLRWGMSA